MQDKVKEITDKLETGLRELFESGKYQNYLKTMSKFHNYSINNTILISMQRPTASLVAGFKSWQNNFERHVKKGEKGIKILAPSPYKIKEKSEAVNPDSGKKEYTEVEKIIPSFKVISVFDVSQTEGKELPQIGVGKLEGNVDKFNDFMEALVSISPVPVSFEDISDGSKGYYSLMNKQIVIQKDMAEIQTIKTAIHEITHAKLHDRSSIDPLTDKRKDQNTKEVEAESVAFTVCNHFGIDTSEYSFAYVASWSSGKELGELKNSMETIRVTSSEIIEDLDARLTALEMARQEENLKSVAALAESKAEYIIQKEEIPEIRNPELDFLRGSENSFAIYQIKKEESLIYYRFEGTESLKEYGLEVDKKNYEMVYSAPLEEGQTADSIYQEFNLYRPDDFKGHSLSVSDIIVFHQNGENTAQFVDSFGFTEIPDFVKEPEELAVEFHDRYLNIQKSDEGYDYTFYDKQFHEMDGGVLENNDITASQALHTILVDEPFFQGNRKYVDPVALEEKVFAKHESREERIEKNPFAKAEQYVEENYNQIDGCFSNIAPPDHTADKNPTQRDLPVRMKLKAGKERVAKVREEKKNEGQNTEKSGKTNTDHKKNDPIR